MKRAILISGGYDSAVAFYKRDKSKSYDYVFFNYSQKYLQLERVAALKFCKLNNIELIELEFKGETDCLFRNFLFLIYLRWKGYREVHVGVRNILPIFDKYKDSNYLSLKLLGHLIGTKVKFPILLWTKTRIFNFLKKKKAYSLLYNCYDNKEDYKTCTCVNCKEKLKYESK